MQTQCDVPKSVPAPVLSPEAIKLITEVCFLPTDEISPENMVGSFGSVLIFGTPYPANQRQVVDTFFNLLDGLYWPDDVYITGGETVHGKIESREIYSLMSDRAINFTRQAYNRFSAMRFHLDMVSKNTLDNVRGAIVAGLGTFETGIIFIAKAAACGRCKLTLNKWLPDATVRALGYDAVPHDGIGSTTRDTWHMQPDIRDRIWAQFLRIPTYAECGHIAYPSSVRQKVERVLELTRM